MFEVFAGEPQFSQHRFRKRKARPVHRRLWTLLGCSASLMAYGTLPVANAQDVPASPTMVSVRPLPEQISAMPSISQSLDVVQHRSQLIVGRSNIVRSAIADPAIVEVAQYSPNELAIIGLQVGTTTLTLWFDKNPQPLIYLVNTVRDPSVDERRRTDFAKLERKLGLLFPNSKIFLIPFSGKIVVKGQAHDSEEAATILQIIRGEFGGSQASANGQSRPAGCLTGQQTSNKPAESPTDSIVNMLEIPGEFQVMLRVRIAELDRSQLRRMGVDLTHLLFDSRHWAQSGRGRSSASAGIFENGEIRSVMNGLMANGTAKILSEPVLTVVSGHAASFLSGGEFAVPSAVGFDGSGAKPTTFHNFGTSLVVTPVVLDRDLIRMNIAPEFSQLNAGNTVNGIPGVDTRRAETTVQLREGQTIVLAGLISHKTTTETSHIKFLGDLPVVGPKYFSGKRSKQDETELLILVTPEIVRPMDADEVPPVPGHEVTAPNDCELYRYGMTEGTPDPTVYQLPPYGAGHSAGVPVGYHLFEQQAGPAVSPPPISQAPMPPVPIRQVDAMPQNAVPQYTAPPYTVPQNTVPQDSVPPNDVPVNNGGLVIPPAAPPAVSQYTPAVASPSSTPVPQIEQQTGNNPPLLPVNPGLDAPPPINIAPLYKTAISSANMPIGNSNAPIRQTSAWTSEPQRPASTTQAEPIPSWSQRPINSFHSTKPVPQHPASDGPTIIPGPLPTAPPADSIATGSSPQ
jgi:pilus assembly protein CpaC